VQPLFGDVAVVLFVSQVGRRLNEALTCLIVNASIPMVDGCGLEPMLTAISIFRLGLYESLFSLLLVLFHESLLLFGECSSLLLLELFHSFIGGPWSIEVSLACITKFLTLSS
jgi:hypothetical protein